MHILIDTNCWVDLLKNNIEEENLSQLNFWVRADKVTLLIPETIKQEWEKQKVFQLKELKAQNNKAFESVNSETKDILKANYANIKRKAALIDDLFSKGVYFEPNKAVHAQVSIRYSKNMAPFHNDKNSHSDAYLYLSTIEYLIKKNIQQLVFVTRDHDDFGDPNNRQFNLHPDLLFDKVSVRYYGQIGLAISELKKELGGNYSNSDDSDIDFTSQYNLLDNPEKFKLIDQIYMSLDRFSTEVSFIPTHILAKVFPIKILNAKHDYAYHSSFQLNSNNDELHGFFQSFEISKTNTIKIKNKEFTSQVKNSKNKISAILKKLNLNLIYDINIIGRQENVDIRLKDNKSLCKCIQCSYNRFELDHAYSLLQTTPQQEDRETLKQAYIHYQFGNFDTSLKLFHHIYEKSKGNGKTILSFICLYNLKQLRKYIRRHFSSIDQKADTIIKSINKISLKKAKASASHQSPFVEDIINWISDNQFFSDAFQNVDEVLEKIREHYYSQLRGGFSSNSNFDILISHFAELDQFLDLNFIIFNNFSEYENVIDKFLEGLLMIYSFNKHQSQRISFINEYLLLKIITYAKRETIIKYYKRFHLTSLTYQGTSKNEPRFEEIALGFLSAFKKLKTLPSSENKIGFFFWEKYKKIFDNILLMLTLSSTKGDLNKIIKELLIILENEDFIRKLEVNNIGDFIKVKGKFISENLFKELILICIKNPKLHEVEIFMAVKTQLLKYHKKLFIDDAQTFGLIKENFLEKCPKCKTFHHSDLLVHIVPILSEHYQKEIRQSIVIFLNQEFLPDLYYMFSLSDIIDYKLFYKKYLDLIQPPPKGTVTVQHPFNRGEAHFHKLNNLINLAFKNNINLDTPDYQKYHGFSSYYDWILKLEGFDYKNFNPLWILEYQTRYYLKRIFASKKVIENLLPFLRKTNHAYLSSLFIKYVKNTSI